ncbi:zinc finger protein ZFAT isoform X2 [Pleuronectes platessa]|uniref:zinc finger protein ZFAT isoform X2 n=1 Tax=Pleuronectes platessa TaxID=8262 RepID=UPI00232A6B4A|nr:zinc finger protein ZFAT isoform X2 [Pleuronectes platessa]
MDAQGAAGSVFMCRLCNLFSPSRPLLLVHCSQEHPQQEPPGDVIIALQPLASEPVETYSPQETTTEGPAKRKRGRPKGSTKKSKTDSTHLLADNSHGQEEENKKQGGPQNGSIEGESHTRILELNCKKCHRSFSNRRQILKHICLRGDEGDNEEETGGDFVEEDVEDSGSLDPEEAAPIKKKQNTEKAEKTIGRFRSQRSGRSQISKEGDAATENKKSVISVVLKEDQTLPGVFKMVPVENSSGDTESAQVTEPSAVVQSQSQDLSSEATISDNNSEKDQEPSSNPTFTTTTTTEAAASRGFQEYSIKQNNTNLPQSQLKIFTCEFCKKIFKFRHSLVAHLRTHTQEKPFLCPHCDYASAIKANLNVHLRKHTGQKFSCQHCSFTCLSPGHLKVHVERVHMKVKQHCSFCAKKYSDVKNLLKHMEKHHNLKDPKVHQSYQELSLKTRQGLRQLLYHCPTCKRRFKNQLERERHLLVHGPLRPFACLLCDHAATKLDALAAHVKKHLFLYMCSVCDGKFVSCQRLKSHLKESHADLDQEQAFSDCIDNSYFLKQPGGDARGDEERVDTEGGGQEEPRTEQEGEDERMREEGGSNGVGGEQEEPRREQEGEDERMREEGGSNVVGGEQEEPRTEQEGEDKRMSEEGGSNGVGGEEMPGGEAERLETVAGEERENEGEEARAQGESLEDEQVKEEETQDLISIETSTPTDTQDKTTAGEAAQANSEDPCTPAAENIDSNEHNTKTCPSPENNHSPHTEERTQENTHAAKNTDAPSASGNSDLPDLGVNTPSSPVPPGTEDQTPHSEKSAFQQVFSSLQKTPLNMETFQQLRRLYGDLECQYCGKLFWYKVQYNIHVRTHTKEHLHYCTKCSYSSITKSSLKRHQIQKHSGLLLPCSNPGCKYTTPDKYKLQAHLRTHQEQGKTVSCPVCQQSFTKNKLKNHMKTSHPDGRPVRGKGLISQRAKKCPYCDSYFLRKSREFKQHIWAHEGLKPFLCSLCEYTGRSKSNLKSHMNRHNTERPHLCDLCGKKFKSKVTLKCHRQSHTKEGKRFQCSECDFAAVSKPSLLRHKEQHSQFKPFRCAHCRYSCNLTGPLKRHYSLKHPEQKYENAGTGLPTADALKQQGGKKCPDCDFVYGTKWELNRHMKNKHIQRVETWETGETIEAHYVTEEMLTEEPVAVLHDNVDIQEITEFSSETHDAVTSMVAMAPGTVTVVQQGGDEQEIENCGEQLMVVNEDGDLTGDQVMVVEDEHGLEALTVLTQGENTHHYIVYVQEHTVEIN